MIRNYDEHIICWDFCLKTQSIYNDFTQHCPCICFRIFHFFVRRLDDFKPANSLYLIKFFFSSSVFYFSFALFKHLKKNRAEKGQHCVAKTNGFSGTDSNHQTKIKWKRWNKNETLVLFELDGKEAKFFGTWSDVNILHKSTITNELFAHSHN